MKLHIHCKNMITYHNFVYFIAPNPPDYITSFSGSALPFHNKDQAFKNTKIPERDCKMYQIIE